MSLKPDLSDLQDSIHKQNGIIKFKDALSMGLAFSYPEDLFEALSLFGLQAVCKFSF